MGPPRRSFLVAPSSSSLLPPRRSFFLVAPSSSSLLLPRRFFLLVAPSSSSLLPPRRSFLHCSFPSESRYFIKFSLFHQILIISLNLTKALPTNQPTNGQGLLIL